MTEEPTFAASVGAGRLPPLSGGCSAKAMRVTETIGGSSPVDLEDESGRLPVALPPRLTEQLQRVLRAARVVEVVGRVERVRWYRSLLAYDLEAAA